MDFIFGLLIGFILFSIIKGRPFKIEIKHEYDNKFVQMPDIEDALDPAKANTTNKLDSIYKGMGDIVNNISDLMTGVDTNGKERD